jgi:hypothetical protein
MNVPPPPPPPQHGYGYERPATGHYQKPKKSPLVIIFAILGVLALCCGLPVGMAFFYGSKLVKGAMNVGGCFANVQIMSSALDDYVKKNGKLPNAATWQKDITPFFESPDKEAKEMMNLWTPEGTWSCKSDGQETGFSFNPEYSGKALKDIKDPEKAVVVFETTKVGYNLNGKYEPLPFSSSPKAMAEVMNERRGWLVVTGELKMANIDKSGEVSSEFSQGFNNSFKIKSSKSSKGGDVNFDVATEGKGDENSARE